MYLEMLYNRYSGALEKQALTREEKKQLEKQRRLANKRGRIANKTLTSELPLNVSPHEIEKQLGKATLKDMQAAITPGSKLLDVTKLPSNVLREPSILNTSDVMGRRLTNVEDMLASSKNLNQDLMEGFYNLKGKVTDLTGQNSTLTKSLKATKSALGRGKLFRDMIMRPKGMTQRIGAKFMRNPKTALALSALGLLGAGGAGAGINSMLSGNE